MGSDCYMKWEGMTKKEKEAQLTGFSIDDGRNGYLRASISMFTENSLLRGLFPDRYWKGKGIRYKFSQRGYMALQKAGLFYLISALTGKPIENPKSREYKEFGEGVFKMLEKLDYDKVEKSDSLGFRYSIMWLNSVFSFYELGLKKEEEKKNPEIDISW